MIKMKKKNPLHLVPSRVPSEISPIKCLHMSHSTKVEEFLSLKQILLFLLSFSSILSLVVCIHLIK